MKELALRRAIHRDGARRAALHPYPLRIISARPTPAFSGAKKLGRCRRPAASLPGCLPQDRRVRMCGSRPELYPLRLAPNKPRSLVRPLGKLFSAHRPTRRTWCEESQLNDAARRTSFLSPPHRSSPRRIRVLRASPQHLFLGARLPPRLGVHGSCLCPPFAADLEYPESPDSNPVLWLSAR